MSKFKFEQEISGWSDFVADCEKQAAEDRKNGFDTTFFPSVVTCKKPKFCLIAMEPSLQGEKSEQIEKDVRNGRRVFFPHTVAYCAWRYLCGKKYDFYITDLDKGVKSVKAASGTKKERWTNWLPLLEKEFDLLGNPPITISLGHGLYDFLCENGIKIGHKIQHYSEVNEKNLRRDYEQLKRDFPEKLLYPDKELKDLTPEEQENLKELKMNPNKANQIIFDSLPKMEEMKDFAKKYREDFGDERYYSEAKIAEIIETDFKSDFSEIQKIIFAIYRYKFAFINKTERRLNKMVDLEKGYEIQTINFKKVVVKGDEPLGKGGQGAVYLVDYDGKPKALKWYTGKNIRNPGEFYANLENNIKKGKPNDAFLWPEDITKKDGEAFGYIMDLIPSEYVSFSKILRNKYVFASTTAKCNASLQIIDGFAALHRKGYSYQDLNDGNFFINTETGDVLICDNDNVSEAGKNSGIAGKARYMAPEIVAKGKMPDKYTDRFSLAVVLFLLWVRDWPLEGKAAHSYPCETSEYTRKIYGENPVFIYDPNDPSNKPVPGPNRNALANWPSLPIYLRNLFEKGFGKEALFDPSRRVIELDWLRTIIRMRSEIYKCSCGEVYFADPVNLNECTKCKKKNSFPFYIKCGKYNLPVHQRTKLYACHTEDNSDDFKTLTGKVTANGNNFELKNCSSKNWTITENGNTKSVVPNEVVTLKKGITINFSNMQAEII